MERRHTTQEMFMLILSTVFCIFLCVQTCTGAMSEVSIRGGHIEVSLRGLVEKRSENSSSSSAPASAPHGTKSSSGAPSLKGNSNKAKPIPSSVSAATGQSWCVAKGNIPDQNLQVALDYACGVGGADCGPIQQGGSCFQPDTVVSHASYAFNSYFQKMGMAPGTCDFGGTAVSTPTDPTYGTCQYTTSGGLSLLNTTSSTPGTPMGLVPPFEPTIDEAHSILINLELSLTLASLLVAVLMFSCQF